MKISSNNKMPAIVDSDGLGQSFARLPRTRAVGQYHGRMKTGEHRQLRYRGSGGDLLVFAPRFITDRMKGFEKDIRICLTPVSATHRAGQTHAYFPALAACCGAIEYLGALSIGKPIPISKGLSRGHIQAFAHRYMAQPDYDGEAIRILWNLFRNGTAHHGITSGVWIDQHVDQGRRRITWAIDERTVRPAVKVREKIGTLTRHPPWDCSHTHIATIYLGQLAADVFDAAERLVADIEAGGKALDRFRTAMEVLYPK